MKKQSVSISPNKTPTCYTVVYAKIAGRGGFATRVSAFIRAGYEPVGPPTFILNDTWVYGFQALINHEKVKAVRQQPDEGFRGDDTGA